MGTIISPLKEILRSDSPDAPNSDTTRPLSPLLIGSDVILRVPTSPLTTTGCWAEYTPEGTESKTRSAVQIFPGFMLYLLEHLGLSESAIKAASMAHRLGKLIYDKQVENILESTEAPVTDSLRNDIISALSHIETTFITWKENTLTRKEEKHTFGEVTLLYQNEDGRIYFVIKGKQIPFDNPFLCHLYSSTTKHLGPEALRKIANFLIKHKDAKLKEAKEKNESIYLKPEDTLLARPIQFTPQGDILIHLTRTKVDKIIGEGGEKRVKMAMSLISGQRFASYTLGALEAEREIRQYRFFEGLSSSHLCLRDRATYLLAPKQFLRLPTNVSVMQYYKTRITTLYYERGDLKKALNSKTSLTLDQKKQIFSELIEAVAKQHEKGLIHRDIKPANILLSDTGIVMADLGMSCSFEDTESKSEGWGTTSYLAPEYLKASVENSWKASLLKEALAKATTPAIDTWALGCTLAELLGLFSNTIPNCGCYLPWAEYSKKEVLHDYFEIFDFVFGELPKNSPQELVARMLDKNSTTRITMKEAFERLATLDWTLLKPFTS